MNNTATDWRNQGERSSRFMLRLLVFIALHVKRGIVRMILYPTVAYFLATSPASRAASRAYLRRVLPQAPTWRDQWHHFFAFASCTLDRIFLLSKKHEQIQVDAHWGPGIHPIVSKGHGCLLLVAHFGSPEALRLIPPPPDDAALSATSRDDIIKTEAKPQPTTILLDRHHGQMLTELLERLNPELAITIIDASERGPHLVLSLKDSLAAGRMVCLSADRAAKDESATTVNFLGSPARFTAVPWILAGTLRVPVILGFGIYRGGNRYTAHFELLSESIDLPRATREQAVNQWAQTYAQRLEHYARMAPYNWFNFYNFWE